MRVFCQDVCLCTHMGLVSGALKLEVQMVLSHRVGAGTPKSRSALKWAISLAPWTARELIVILSFIFSCLLDSYEEQKKVDLNLSLSYRFKSTFILVLCVPNPLFVFDSFWSSGFLNHILLWSMHGVDGATLSVPPSTFSWTLGIRLRSSGLEASTFAHRAIFSSQAFVVMSFIFLSHSQLFPLLLWGGSPLCISKWHY